MWTMNSDYCIIVIHTRSIKRKELKKKTDYKNSVHHCKIHLCFFGLVNLFHFGYRKIDKCFMYTQSGKQKTVNSKQLKPLKRCEWANNKSQWNICLSSLHDKQQVQKNINHCTTYICIWSYDTYQMTLLNLSRNENFNLFSYT